MKRRYLVLASGEVFEGFAAGADAEGLGELVFTTNMCGYLETLTDPSYAGQIILQTFPLIGNYGVIEEDFEASAGRGATWRGRSASTRRTSAPRRRWTNFCARRACRRFTGSTRARSRGFCGKTG